LLVWSDEVGWLNMPVSVENVTKLSFPPKRLTFYLGIFLGKIHQSLFAFWHAPVDEIG
jgi:hypothetical protein